MCRVYMIYADRQTIPWIFKSRGEMCATLDNNRKTLKMLLVYKFQWQFHLMKRYDEFNLPTKIYCHDSYNRRNFYETHYFSPDVLCYRRTAIIRIIVTMHWQNGTRISHVDMFRSPEVWGLSLVRFPLIVYRIIISSGTFKKRHLILD